MTDKFSGRDLMSAATIEAELLKKSRTRSAAPNKSSTESIMKFIKGAADAYPLLMGEGAAKIKHADSFPELVPTLLSRIIMAVDYHPSSLSVLANHKELARKGIITDDDLSKVTLRIMTDHCTRPMLTELEGAMLKHEAKLQAAADAVPTARESKFEPVTEVIEDDVLGLVKVNSDTGVIVEILGETKPIGEALVDDASTIEVTNDTETAKQSKVWGSW